MMRRTPDQWDSDLAWFAAMEGDTQTGQLYRDIRHDMALLAGSVPSTHPPTVSRDQTGIREAGKEVLQDLVDRQEPLGAEFEAAIYDNIDDLYET